MLAFALRALLLLAAPARALTPEQQGVVQKGMDALYRSDFDGAESAFGESMSRHPGDPVYSLGYATSVWWRMEHDLALSDSPEEQRFFSALGKAIDDAKEATRSPDKQQRAEAYLCLGAAYGLKGRREAAEAHWMTAYFDGRRSYRSEQEAIQLEPTLYDAYLGIGAFDYYTARLSRFIRMFSFAKGDKARGLEELQLAAQRGEFSRVAAQLLLVGVDWTFEKRPEDAWTLLEEVHKRYPGSPLVDTLRLIGLYHLRDAAGLKREARLFLEKADGGAPFFRPVDRAAGRYFLGLGKQLSGDYPGALDDYQAALKFVPRGQRLRGLLRLFIGESCDLMGRREEALAAYRQALADPPFWGVQRYARFLLKRPFTSGLDPLPPRNVALGQS